MKKKIISVLLGMALVATMFTGCGKKETGTSDANKETPKKETTQKDEPGADEEDTADPVSIVWAGWSGEEEASKDVFGRMMDQYHEDTGNNVNWVGWTWADTAQQLLIRTQGGEQLDIAQIDLGMFNTLAEAGVLADWNDVVGADYLSDNFEQATLETGNVDGKQLALPWSMAAITMVYNPEILAEAGWDKEPVTMEEFEACLADVSKLGGDIIPYGVSTKDATSAGDFMPWLWTFGGSVFDKDGNVTINSEAAVKCVTWYQDMLGKGYIAMDIGRGDARQLFAQGKMAFYDDAVVAKGQAVSNGVNPDEVVNVCSAMPRPTFDGGKAQSTMWGHMLVLFNESGFKNQAADLAKTLVSDNVALDYFVNNGMPPVTKSASALDEIKNDAYIKGFIKSTATAKLEDTAKMINASEIKSIITDQLQSALLGQKTAEQAVKDMAAAMQ